MQKNQMLMMKFTTLMDAHTSFGISISKKLPTYTLPAFLLLNVTLSRDIEEQFLNAFICVFNLIPPSTLLCTVKTKAVFHTAMLLEFYW